MPLALQKSTDGGVTFEQVSLSVADYTLTDGISSYFLSVKDSQNNTYIYCRGNTGSEVKGKLIKISNTGVITVGILDWDYSGCYFATQNQSLHLTRDENLLLKTRDGTAYRIFYINKDFTSGNIPPNPIIGLESTASSITHQIAIYKDQYIWVASGTTVKIYNYDTKAELAIAGIQYGSSSGYTASMCVNENNELYLMNQSQQTNDVTKFNIIKYIYSGISLQMYYTNQFIMIPYAKQLLIDRFGDLNILTNSGTASTLLKYSNTGTLIDTVNLSVGTNKGAYGLQVYSSDNGTKCWVQFSNDLGTWRTAETTAQGQVFPGNKEDGTTIIKLRDNGVTTYGDDHGGDNNYSVWCP